MIVPKTAIALVAATLSALGLVDQVDSLVSTLTYVLLSGLIVTVAVL